MRRGLWIFFEFCHNLGLGYFSLKGFSKSVGFFKNFGQVLIFFPQIFVGGRYGCCVVLCQFIADIDRGNI